MLAAAWPYVLGRAASRLLKSSCLSFGSPTPLFLGVASNIPLSLQAGILVHMWRGNYHQHLHLI